MNQACVILHAPSIIILCNDIRCSLDYTIIIAVFYIIAWLLCIYTIRYKYIVGRSDTVLPSSGSKKQARAFESYEDCTCKFTICCLSYVRTRLLLTGPDTTM